MKKSHRRTLLYLRTFGPVTLLPGHGTGLRFSTCSELRDLGFVQFCKLEIDVSLTPSGRAKADELLKDLTLAPLRDRVRSKERDEEYWP